MPSTAQLYECDQRVLDVDPSLCASSLAKRGQHVEAVRLLETHLAKDPRAADAYLVLIAILARGGEIQRARHTAELAAVALGKDSKTAIIGGLAVAAADPQHVDFLRLSGASATLFPDSVLGLVGRLEGMGSSASHERLNEIVRFCHFIPQQDAQDIGILRGIAERELSEGARLSESTFSADLAEILRWLR